MIAELRAAAGGRLDAGVRHHSRHDDLFDAALLQLEVEVGIGKSVLAPMLLDHNVARLRYEFGMPFAAPHAFPEDGFVIGRSLPRAGMTPSVIIALAPPHVGNVEHHDTGAARRLDEHAQMRQQFDGLGDRLGLRPQLAPVAQQVIVRIDEQQSGPLRGIITQCQDPLPKITSHKDRWKSPTDNAAGRAVERN